MDYYQSIVAQWLVSDGRTFLAEEYYLRTSRVREFKHRDQTYLWPDIIAVRLRDRKVFLCEVTWSRNWGTIERKLEKYSENMPEIRDALDHWLGIPHDFDASIWYFVPEDHIAKIRERNALGSVASCSPRWRKSSHGNIRMANAVTDGPDYSE